MKYIFIFSLYISLFAQDYPYFSKQELTSIAKKDKHAKNRILNYEKNMQSLRYKSQKEQLKTINFQLNRLLPQYDSVINKKEDNWATPKEFLQVGFGDCEDYVLLKYYSLIKLGFDEKKLFLTIVKENYYGGHHMVLSYFEKKETSPLILDNLSFKILTLEKRPDLSAEIFINSQGVYKLNAKNKLIKVANRYKEFEALKKKIKQNF
jgi:predicted transglutaminase-like cysteine proteinase